MASMSDAFTRPRVLLAANGSATWTGIRIALNDASIDICGEVDHALDLPAEAARLDANVCLVDVALPGGGLQAVGELTGRRPRVAVIVLTPQVDQDDFMVAQPWLKGVEESHKVTEPNTLNLAELSVG